MAITIQRPMISAPEERAERPVESLASLLSLISPRIDEAGLELVKRAYGVAEEAHHLQQRKSGEPYIVHPLAVAGLLAAIVAWRTKNVLWTIAVGMAALWLLQAVG